LGSMQGIDPESIIEHVVSRAVNSVRNNGPGLNQPAERETLF